MTSTDYARLLQYIAIRKYNIMLDKIHIQKMLYYIYGACLADHNRRLFDEKPQAWAYGPVFPKSYRSFDADEVINDYPDEMLSEANRDGFGRTILEVVKNMYRLSFSELMRWAHECDSPWDKTIYEYDEDGVFIRQNPWSSIIRDEETKKYFQQPQHRIYG